MTHKAIGRLKVKELKKLLPEKFKELEGVYNHNPDGNNFNLIQDWGKFPFGALYHRIENLPETKSIKKIHKILDKIRELLKNK